jgi:hypothetical protein
MLDRIVPPFCGFLMLLSTLQPAVPKPPQQARVYHRVTLERLAAGTRHTHVCVTGPVVYVRKQRDGDWHVTLDNGKTKVVLEIIPAIPVALPRKGDVVDACGISRRDTHHGWPEVHPVEWLAVVKKANR